ncbi:SufS family cysteine desulfurase [Candidatus Dependentiae bacterium]|nr:SufS family cysteine desulfurase [Candidatus Dependentiae bacterium]
MDIKKIREKFPIFKGGDGGKRLVYLDSAATSQRADMVIDSVHDFYSRGNASVHRGVYELSERATGLYEQARHKVAKFINAADPSEIVFTSGTTESINFVADAWAREHFKEGDEIVVTQAEHHANLLPWQRVAQRTGAKLRFIEVDQETFFLKDPPKDLINKNTKLVSLIHISNVLGNVWEEGLLESVIKRAHEVGARVLLDCAQSIAHKKIDVQALGVDFLACSAHKMCGPTGVGALYIKKDLHDAVEPYQVGGSMVHDAEYETANWQPAPMKFEAGTPAIAQVIGFGAAVDFFNEHVDFVELHNHEAKLCAQLVDGLNSIGGITILGNQCDMKMCGHLAAFVVDGIHAHDVSAMLGMRGVGVRAGHHCVQPLAKLIGVEASTRASLYMYNESEDIEVLVRELRDLIKTFKEA